MSIRAPLLAHPDRFAEGFLSSDCQPVRLRGPDTLFSRARWAAILAKMPDSANGHMHGLVPIAAA